MQVRALYDFEAQPGSGELCLKAGELLTVTKQDVGDGWWEGVNEDGVHGLFPASYVEQVSIGGPPSIPPPPLPDDVLTRQPQPVAIQEQVTDNGFGYATESVRDTFTSGLSQRSLSNASGQKYGQSSGGGDEFDDDFSRSDDESAMEHRPGDSAMRLTPTRRSTRSAHSNEGDGRDGESDRQKQYLEEPSYGAALLSPRTPSPDTGTEQEDFDERCHSAEPTESTFEGTARPVVTGGGGVKKSINRFSRFVQSGMEAFILNQVKLAAPNQKDMFDITMTTFGPKWAMNVQNQYTCRLSSYKKASKMKGLKSFINYELTPSFSPNSSVERRYKHFEWLYSRLESKFTFMLLPPLPERQIAGRSEEDSVEHRMQLLQMWIDKICRHPVMSKADVWMHFLTVSPDGKEWKNGKRKAEKDQYVGGHFFFTVSAPTQQVDPATVEQRFDIFSRKAKALDDAVRSTGAAAAESIKHVCGPLRGEFLKYGNAFRTLSQAMTDESGSNAASGQLAAALRATGDKYDAVAKMCADQPRTDLEPLQDQLFVYKGLLSSVPRIVQTGKNVLSRLREHQKLAEDGKMAPAELEAIRSRVDTVSYALLAEANHFELEHVRDMKALVKEFLFAQVAFYDNVRTELQEGTIAVGSDADVVIRDPKATRTISAKTHHHAVDFNIFEGMTCHGVPLVTISGGRIVWETGNLNVAKGVGKFFELRPYSSIVYDTILQRNDVVKPAKVARTPA